MSILFLHVEIANRENSVICLIFVVWKFSWHISWREGKFREEDFCRTFKALRGTRRATNR